MQTLIKPALPMLGAAIAFSLVLVPPAQAAYPCRTIQGHEICLEQVQRSAKYHWRYRVKAIVDGQPQPLTRYNCRDLTRQVIERGFPKLDPEAFPPNSVGSLVCKLVRR